MSRQSPPAPPPWRQRMPSAPWPLDGRQGSTAHHEAGHLVTARLVGFTPGNAVASQGKGGRAMIGIDGNAPDPITTDELDRPMPPPEIYAEVFDQTWPGSWGGRSYQQAAFDYCTVVVAGRQAELINAGVEIAKPCAFPLWDHDHLVAIAILNRVGENAALGWCQARARELLAANWDEVEQQAEKIARDSKATA